MNSRESTNSVGRLDKTPLTNLRRSECSVPHQLINLPCPHRLQSPPPPPPPPKQTNLIVVLWTDRTFRSSLSNLKLKPATYNNKHSVHWRNYPRPTPQPRIFATWECRFLRGRFEPWRPSWAWIHRGRIFRGKALRPRRKVGIRGHSTKHKTMHANTHAPPQGSLDCGQGLASVSLNTLDITDTSEFYSRNVSGLWCASVSWIKNR